MLKQLRILPAILLVSVVVLLSGLVAGPLAAQTPEVVDLEGTKRDIPGFESLDKPIDSLKYPASKAKRNYACVSEIYRAPEALNNPEPPGYKKLCPDGQIPWPIPRIAPKGQPDIHGEGVVPDPESPNNNQPAPQATVPNTSAVYVHETYYKDVAATGVSSGLTVANPEISSIDYNTLMEILISTSDTTKKIEVGWIISPKTSLSAKQATFFVFRRTSSADQGAYNASSQFTQVSANVVPGTTVLSTSGNTPGTINTFKIIHQAATSTSSGRWNIYFNTTLVGYYNDSLWSNSFVQGQEVQWYGEIAKPTSQSGITSCTDMGTGKQGSAGQAGGAAAITNMAYNAADGSTVYPTSFGEIGYLENPSYSYKDPLDSTPPGMTGYVGGSGSGKCSGSATTKPISFDNVCNADLLAYLSGVEYATFNGYGSETQLPNFGGPGDNAVPGKYLGSGFTNLTLWRPSTGQWFPSPTNSGGSASAIVSGLGQAGDTPVPGDYNGDGITDAAIWRKSDGHWLYYSNITHGTTDLGAWGLASQNDVAIPADMNGDGLVDRVIYRYNNNSWYVWYNGATSGVSVTPIPGTNSSTWIPEVYDYNGDGYADFGMYNTSDGHWLVKDHVNGQTYDYGNYGGPGYVPVVDYYTCNKRPGLGVYNTSTDDGRWYFMDLNSGTRYDEGYLANHTFQLTYQYYPPNYSQPTTPIIIDTLGNGYDLTSEFKGVMFDIMGTGQPMAIAWTSPGSDDAFLALDRNGNGTIDSGKELFGNFTDQPPSKDPNGFLALAQFDSNNDGQIDQQDKVFNALLLWKDLNHDGVSQPAEKFSLKALGVSTLRLNYKLSSQTDENGNRFRYRTQVLDSRGSQVGRWAWDVLLRFQTPETASAAFATEVAPTFIPPPGGYPVQQP